MLTGKITIGQRLLNAIFHLLAGRFFALLGVDRLEHLSHQLHLGMWCNSKHIPVKVDCTPLIFSLMEHFTHGFQHTKALVTNHQFDPIQTTTTQPLEKADLAGLVFFHALGRTKNLEVAILVDSNGY